MSELSALAVGTKVVKFIPMTAHAFSEYTNRKITSAQEREGYLVEYEPQPNDVRCKGHDGYISWTPKEVFEKSYKFNGKFEFGHALFLAKRGLKVARSGWNGAGMFAYIVDKGHYKAKTKAIRGFFEDDIVPYRAYWAIKPAQDDVTPWSPSGSDTLADDWVVVQ